MCVCNTHMHGGPENTACVPCTTNMCVSFSRCITNSHPCPKHPPPHTHRLNATPPTTAVIRSHTTALCIQQTHPQPSLHSSSPHPAQDMEPTACTTKRPSAPGLATATACTQPCPRSCLAPLAALQSLLPAAHQGREVGHWGPLGCSAILHPAPHHPGAQGAAGGGCGCGCCHGPVAVVAAWSVLPQQGVLQWQHQRWLLQLVAARHQLHAPSCSSELCEPAYHNVSSWWSEAGTAGGNTAMCSELQCCIQCNAACRICMPLR